MEIELAKKNAQLLLRKRIQHKTEQLLQSNTELRRRNVQQKAEENEENEEDENTGLSKEPSFLELEDITRCVVCCVVLCLGISVFVILS